MNAISLSAVCATVTLLLLASVTYSSAAWVQSCEIFEILDMGHSTCITVFQNSDFATEMQISERGTIMFPLIGEMVIAGLTPTQAGSQIAQQLMSERKVILITAGMG